MTYEESMTLELELWKRKMKAKPSMTSQLSRKLQRKINSVIPEKIHMAFTSAIKHMTRAVCFGAEFTTQTPFISADLQDRENKVRERIKFYSKTAAAEGAVTGAGGILLGLADFPIWLGLKMKMLFEISALYGH